MICMLDIDLTIVSNASEQLVIQLGCGHAWTVCSLDGMLQLDQLFYERDLRTGQWTGLRETTIQDVTAAGLKAECPTCKKKITRIPRYGRALNFLAFTSTFTSGLQTLCSSLLSLIFLL